MQKQNNPKRSLFLLFLIGVGTGAQQWKECGGGLPGGLPLPILLRMAPAAPRLPLCQKMERQVSLLNAVWEPSTDGLVTRLGQCWRDASFACREERVVTQGQLPALGHCHPQGSRAGREWKQRQDMVGGFPSPSPPVALTLALTLSCHLPAQALPTPQGS